MPALKESTAAGWLGPGVAWETNAGGREVEPGQQGSKADVLPWKLAPLLRTLLLLRSTGRVCCEEKEGRRSVIGKTATLQLDVKDVE